MVAQLPLTDLAKVTFYKRDELTTDLICCDVMVGTKCGHSTRNSSTGICSSHLQGLPSFRGDWFAAVSQPPFANSEAVALSRQ